MGLLSGLGALFRPYVPPTTTPTPATDDTQNTQQQNTQETQNTGAGSESGSGGNEAAASGATNVVTETVTEAAGAVNQTVVTAVDTTTKTLTSASNGLGLGSTLTGGLGTPIDEGAVKADFSFDWKALAETEAKAQEKAVVEDKEVDVDLERQRAIEAQDSWRMSQIVESLGTDRRVNGDISELMAPAEAANVNPSAPEAGAAQGLRQAPEAA